MNNTEGILKVILGFHIAGGTLALLTGLGAMFTAKGSKVHRRFGKVYFWSMTMVFVSALVLSVAHEITFLLMVAFFSYYFTVRGYRILYLKALDKSQRPTWIDWTIGLVSGVFIFSLIGWGFYSLFHRDMMGVVAIVFGSIGTTFLVGDVRNFTTPPRHMHWWYGHIASMGASYISASTAFVVVNLTIPGYNWVLWILPSIVGGWLIGRTIRKYRVKFDVSK